MSSTLWLIDRSRVSDGRGFCKKSRYLNYHSGPHGYGIQLKATKIPLMTGILGHDGLRPILEWCRDHDAEIVQFFATAARGEDGTVPCPVPDAVIRTGVQTALDEYAQAVTKRGFAYLSEDESVQGIVREQQCLIEGLIWAWTIEVLPETLLRGRVLEVEQDDVYVIGCTCGLGDGVLAQADHEARDCQGIGLQCRPDFLLETRLTQELEYHEFKTTGQDGPSFRDKWEVMIQLFAATLDAERRHQRHVQSIYVHGLIKGKRQGEYNYATKTYDGPQIQQSIFCYGYRKPANPPMEAEEWAAQYEWTDADGKGHRLPKVFRKTGVWELPESYCGAGMSRAETWAKWMPSAVRRKQFVLLGPFSRQTQMVAHFVDETLGEEAAWQQGLWELYDLGSQILAEAYPDGAPDAAAWWEVVWPDPRFQSRLDRTFPRSYECRRYGMRHRCQFENICFEREGWADPLGSGQYILRRPHHQAELDQAVARGLLLPEAALGEDAEESL